MSGYKAEFKEEEKEQIIKKFLPFIKYTAYRLSWRLPPHLTTDDLISAGFIGLVDALGRFEHGRVKLKTYAELRIKGAMLDELRATDWLPRSMRKKIGSINSAYRKLENELGRMPGEKEVAEALKMSLDEYYKALQCATTAVTIRLEDFTGNVHTAGNLNIFECLADSNKMKNPLNMVEEKDTKEMIARLIDTLSERERYVLSLYYWDELTMKEIGRVLNVTESRVCQIHGQALIKLKVKLNRSN